MNEIQNYHELSEPRPRGDALSTCFLPPSFSLHMDWQAAQQAPFKQNTSHTSSVVFVAWVPGRAGTRL